MNTADFNSQPDGFPLESDATLGFMQSTYLDGMRALAKITGLDEIILTGLEITGGSVSEGWILKDGDLVFFAAGAYLDTYVISTSVVQKANQNGALVDRYFTKVAQFGTGASEHDFTALIRVDNIKTIQDSIAYIAKSETGSPIWTVLDGCEPVTAGVGGISSGRVLYRGRFLIVAPYGSAVSSGSPVYLKPDGSWTVNFDNEYLQFNPYTTNRISIKYRQSILPVGSTMFFATADFPTEHFPTNTGINEWEGWRIADGTLGTIDLTGVSGDATPIQRKS